MAVVLTPVEEMTTLVCLGLEKDVQINSEGALLSFFKFFAQQFQ